MRPATGRRYRARRLDPWKAAPRLRLQADAGRAGVFYGRDMKRTYAVVWSENGSVASGRLEAAADGFELTGRDQRLSIPFEELEGASIERGRADRLHGLPVLELHRTSRLPVRIASLEGTIALHELFDQVGRACFGPAARRNAA